MSGNSAADNRKALSCLCDFVMEHPEIKGVSPELFLCNWVVSMYWRGLTVKTAIHYLDLISALYSSAIKEGKAEETDVFRKVKAKVKRLSPEIWCRRIPDESFARFSGFVKLAGRQQAELSVFADMVLFSLLNKGMPLADVANLKRSDLSGCGAASAEIAKRHVEPHRRYVFPLRQSYRTSRQLNDYVSARITHLLLSRNVMLTGSVEDTLKAYWAFAALKSGASGTAVLNELGAVPENLPVLGLCGGEESVGATGNAGLAEIVTGVFQSNPVGWYAMHLRPGVKFDALTARLSALKKQVGQPELFYPMEEIALRLKKKIVYKEVPVLPDIVFFRSRLTEIQTMFAHIGDLAWCYKTGNAYAAIPSWEMERFQQAVGTFTPDTEICPAGTIRLEKNDRVEILGGMFVGRSARFDTEVSESTVRGASRTIYRLLLSADNGIEWMVKIAPQLVRKAAKSEAAASPAG